MTSANYIGELPAVKLSGGHSEIIVPASASRQVAREYFEGDCRQTDAGDLHFVQATGRWSFGEWNPSLPIWNQFVGFTSENAARREAGRSEYVK